MNVLMVYVIYCRCIEVPKSEGTTTIPSLLSLQLRAEHNQGNSGDKMTASHLKSVKGSKGLTIYAPDTSPIEVFVNTGDSVSTVIQKALEAHEAAEMDPPLHYRNPECYDLRLHDGK